MKMFSSLLLCLAFGSFVMADDAVQLFNGKSLDGWEGDTDLWSVEDGAITGRTESRTQLRANQFLIWKGGTVGDFELSLEFRLEGDNNSGVQYRSRRLADVGDFIVGGYQADIHPRPEYLGMLYEERGRGIIAQRGQKVVVQENAERTTESLGVEVTNKDLTEWHELRIIAVGNQITHELDGDKVMVLLDHEKEKRSLEGILALQVHRGPPMKVQFRNIRLKKLAAGEADAR